MKLILILLNDLLFFALNCLSLKNEFAYLLKLEYHQLASQPF